MLQVARLEVSGAGNRIFELAVQNCETPRGTSPILESASAFAVHVLKCVPRLLSGDQLLLPLVDLDTSETARGTVWADNSEAFFQTVLSSASAFSKAFAAQSSTPASDEASVFWQGPFEGIRWDIPVRGMIGRR